MSDKKVDKKKKTTDKKKVEPEKKVGRKPPAALVAAIKANQDKANAEKEEAERREREEEEKLRLLAEKKAEEARLKAEKKERKKVKERERREKERLAGVYLTEAQRKKLKEDRARLGINVDRAADEAGECQTKKVVYGKKKKRIEKGEDPAEKGEGKENIGEGVENIEEGVENISDEELVEKEAGSDQDSLEDWERMADKDVDEVVMIYSEEEDVILSKPKVNYNNKSVSKEEKVAEKARIVQKNKEEEEIEKMELVKNKIAIKHKECESNRDETKLRAPIVCVLGHVDTGKTSLLDKLRNTDVQGGETGGITQQIGATNVPLHSYPSVALALPHLLLPGLLIIDTPGHESFSNMRSRGSSLCDVAVLVVDLMHGVEEQTKESIKLLRKGKVPFVIALNKVDRLVSWVTKPEKPIKDVIASQMPNTKADFKDRLNQTIAHFATCEINVRCFWEEDDDEDYVSMVPTSAHTGDGMGDLIAYICKMSQLKLAKRLSFSEELQASVMEVKETPGHGTTLDVILVNGRLRSNDTIVVGGQEGPIATKIRYLIKPAPMIELRVKGEYTKESECVAAQGVKIVAKDLEKAMPGLPLYCATTDDEVTFYKQELTRSLDNILKSIKVADVGLFVQTSTIGSMEALLTFLRQQKIPFSGINIGTIHKKDIMRATAMKEREPKWAVILAFNVKVEAEAELQAKLNGITIFRQEIIYRLYDDLTQYLENLSQQNKDRLKDQVVFPVALQIIPENIFSKRNPILCGVTVKEGTLKMGTPLFVVVDNVIVMIGKAMTLEMNHHSVSEAKTDQCVCVRIDPLQGDTPKMLGRHFKETDIIYSKVTRDSIDILKEYYRDAMTTEDWKLVVKLKQILGIL